MEKQLIKKQWTLIHRAWLYADVNCTEEEYQEIERLILEMLGEKR